MPSSPSRVNGRLPPKFLCSCDKHLSVDRLAIRPQRAVKRLMCALPLHIDNAAYATRQPSVEAVRTRRRRLCLRRHCASGSERSLAVTTLMARECSRDHNSRCD